MIVGVTATQTGATSPQLETLRRMLEPRFVTEFHHGACVGGDAQAHEIFRELKAADPGWRRIVLHPGYDPRNPDDMNRRAPCEGADIVRPAKPFLERDDDIIWVVDQLIGIPRHFTEQLRSGTWATLRHAYKHGTQALVIRPDGTLIPFVPETRKRSLKPARLKPGDQLTDMDELRKSMLPSSPGLWTE